MPHLSYREARLQPQTSLERTRSSGRTWCLQTCKTPPLRVRVQAPQKAVIHPKRVSLPLLKVIIEHHALPCGPSRKSRDTTKAVGSCPTRGTVPCTGTPSHPRHRLARRSSVGMMIVADLGNGQICCRAIKRAGNLVAKVAHFCVLPDTQLRARPKSAGRC